MSKRIFQLLLVACLVTGALWAADDPFVGKWKLNPSKIKLTDEMKVTAVGANKYVFDFGGGDPETIVADGTDQPGHFGTTLSVTVEGPRTWKVVSKQGGRTLVTAIWTLSSDGNTLNDDFRGRLNLNYVYKRTSAGSGFVGTWESTSEQVSSAVEIQIQPYEGDGLSFNTPGEHEIQNIRFDGKDYPDVGPHLPAGYAASGRRVNERTLELTDKLDGKVLDTRQIRISSDLKTLTMTVHYVRRSSPNIRVFDRE
ncbi:MAG TPA: hypothetical protein VEO19_10520 [Terriglobia bacterium]|nr:hypothetical protein [Terriglobia bacterium]